MVGKPPLNTAQLRAITICDLPPLDGPIVLEEYDPLWPRIFEEQTAKIGEALGDAALAIEHVGRRACVRARSGGGRVRASHPGAEWFEHRMPRRSEPRVNLHVFSADCEEADRMVLFRDWLRANGLDREVYERTKRELAGKRWTYRQNYADAKAAVIEAILARAHGAR